MLKGKKNRNNRKPLKDYKQKSGVIRLGFKQNINHWHKAKTVLGKIFK